MDLILLKNANAERKGFNFVLLCIIAVICQLQKSKPSFICTTRYCEECGAYF